LFLRLVSDQFFIYMKFILGKKLTMTQIWEGDRVIAVTPVSAGPCVVTQVKNEKSDGYSALQIGFGWRKNKNIAKPQLGHLKNANALAPEKHSVRNLKEFRITDVSAEVGDLILVNIFEKGEKIKVTATSKGKGFQGVVKRHHFQGGRKSHGNKDQLRMPGSIGPKGPAHVFKGTRMAGQMGNEQVTITNLSIAAIDEEKGIIYIKGAIPGPISGLISIKADGDLKLVKELPKLEEVKVIEPEVVEAVEEEVITKEVVAEEVSPETPAEEAKQE
jgi:large subunit ribosomal protein L3